MKRLIIALCATLPALSLTACYDGGYYGVGYASGPYAYDGWYDDYYGPIYDGYWGNDGYFYYRNSDHVRDFRRGDQSHFRREGGGDKFHELRGTFNPSAGMHLRNFGDRSRRDGAGDHNRH